MIDSRFTAFTLAACFACGAMLCCAARPIRAAEEPDNGVAAAPPEPAPAPADPQRSEEDKRVEAMEQEAQRLSVESDLHEKRKARELAGLRDEQERLLAEYELLIQRQKNELVRLQLENQKLAAESAVREARSQAELAALKQQVQKLRLESSLREARANQQRAEAKDEIATLNLGKNLRDARAQEQRADAADELARVTLESELREAHRLGEHAGVEAQVAGLNLQMQLRQAKTQEQRADVNDELAQITLENNLRKARRTREQAEVDAEVAELNLQIRLREARSKNELSQIRDEIAKLNLERELEAARTEAAQAQYDTEIAQMTADVKLRDQNEKWKSEVNRKLSYLKEPLQDGVLTISDRRIPLNDVIIEGTADYVTRRIHYFNNKSSEYPIFIVINKCYGGSVMEGYRIVEAMKASKAPVYVVVKSFAASMAAVITTLADKSYAYPNAIILQHQMSSYTWGNLTDQKEQLKMLEEWSKRLLEPVAQKMGTTEAELTKQMYAHNTRGDWQEFADNAVKTKWVNQVVSEIREAGVTKQPTDAAPRPWFWFIFGESQDGKVVDRFEQRDAEGRRYVTLPRLSPYDFYYIYNPDNYYR
ncbi:MAG: ATP-dependent Clp protease proteolytic subunit [Phycisphaeraceae bacterium]